jgi:hypothetical protein
MLILGPAGLRVLTVSRGASSQEGAPVRGGGFSIISRRRRQRVTKTCRRPSETSAWSRNFSLKNHGCLRIRSWFVLIDGWEPSMTALVRFWINHFTATRRNRSQAVGFISASFIKSTLYEVLTESTARRYEIIAPQLNGLNGLNSLNS